MCTYKYVCAIITPLKQTTPSEKNMNTYTITFNHKLNLNGFVINAHDMSEARSEAANLISEGFTVDAVVTITGQVYPL